MGINRLNCARWGSLGLLPFPPENRHPISKKYPGPATGKVNGVSRACGENRLTPFLQSAKYKQGNDGNRKGNPSQPDPRWEGARDQESQDPINNDVSDPVAIGKIIQGAEESGQVSGIRSADDIQKKEEKEQGGEFGFHGLGFLPKQIHGLSVPGIPKLISRRRKLGRRMPEHPPTFVLMFMDAIWDQLMKGMGRECEISMKSAHQSPSKPIKAHPQKWVKSIPDGSPMQRPYLSASATLRESVFPYRFCSPLGPKQAKKEAVLQLPDRFYNRGNPRAMIGSAD